MSGRPAHLSSKLRDADPDEADKRVGLWSRATLIAMDARYCDAVAKALPKVSNRQIAKTLEVVRTNVSKIGTNVPTGIEAGKTVARAGRT
jgi:hypothetical protein